MLVKNCSVLYSLNSAVYFITKKVEFGFITTKRRGKNTWANLFYEAQFQYSIEDNILKEKMQNLVLIFFSKYNFYTRTNFLF